MPYDGKNFAEEICDFVVKDFVQKQPCLIQGRTFCEVKISQISPSCENHKL